MNTDSPSETLMLPGDSEALQSMRQEHEIRGMVARVLKGKEVSPVYIEFRLAHPWLKRLGFGSHDSRRVILAIEKGEKLDADILGKLNTEIHRWAELQTPIISIDSVTTRKAHWLDHVNGYIQQHGTKVTED